MAKQSSRGAAVVTDNTTPLPGGPCSRFYVGGTGDIACRPVGSTADILLKNAPVGYHELQVSHIRTLLTTATNIVALYD